MARIGDSDLDVLPLNLGGNVFGWTADEATSFAVLDAFVDGGGSFVDSADVYSVWKDGNRGGESEEIIGRWLAKRGRREDLVVATKVGKLPGREGLGAANVRAAAEDSLRRLGTDHIDLYYAHADDLETPIEETLRAFDELVREGKVRYVAASNYTGDRLAEALRISEEQGLAKYVAIQPHYNLVERADFESGLVDVVEREGLATLPYYALASGFLTGKYRGGQGSDDSKRSSSASAYAGAHGDAVLAALDEVADAQGASVTSVALAWLRAQRTVVAPIASARNVEQLPDLLASAHLELTRDELTRLDEASAPSAVTGD